MNSQNSIDLFKGALWYCAIAENHLHEEKIEDAEGYLSRAEGVLNALIEAEIGIDEQIFKPVD